MCALLQLVRPEIHDLQPKRMGYVVCIVLGFRRSPATPVIGPGHLDCGVQGRVQARMSTESATMVFAAVMYEQTNPPRRIWRPFAASSSSPVSELLFSSAPLAARLGGVDDEHPARASGRDHRVRKVGDILCLRAVQNGCKTNRSVGAVYPPCHDSHAFARCRDPASPSSAAYTTGAA